jgi:hypothetical protein
MEQELTQEQIEQLESEYLYQQMMEDFWLTQES